MSIVWIILGIIALISLIVFWKNRSAVWGGLTGGIIVGLIVALVYLFRGNGFSWDFLLKGAILGTLIGVGAELLGMLSKKLKTD